MVFLLNLTAEQLTCRFANGRGSNWQPSLPSTYQFSIRMSGTRLGSAEPRAQHVTAREGQRSKERRATDASGA